jgi:ATP-binding cassette subfamily B protein
MKSPTPKSNNLQTLRLYWQFTRPNKKLFLAATIGSVISVIVADILPPLVIAGAFNKLQKLYAHREAITWGIMQPYLIAYVSVCIGAMVLWRTQAYLAWRYMIQSEQRIMDHVFNHLQYMDSKFHSDRFGGALVSQTNKFVSAYDRLASDFNWNILTGVTVFISSMVILALTNPLYAGAFFCGRACLLCCGLSAHG